MLQSKIYIVEALNQVDIIILTLETFILFVFLSNEQVQKCKIAHDFSSVTESGAI